MKGVSILGSTGSIGTNTLDVIRQHRDRYRVIGLAAGKRIDQLADQIVEFEPYIVSIADEADLPKLRERLSDERWRTLDVRYGLNGPCAIAADTRGDVVVTAMVGAIGLAPTLTALERGATVAIANKEPLVMAGCLCTEVARKRGAKIVPVDSEHSAIYQCLAGQATASVEKIYLTCSGGPFRAFDGDLSTVSVAQALAHPTWSMGQKISIDSSTLINKGLEVIEARWLFDLPAEKIEILIHPQSVFHSMVEFVDGAVLAQLGTPDMRVPIAYALAYPDRLPLSIPKLTLSDLASLTFESPNYDRFRGPKLAYDALEAGGTAPAVLNAANEVAVDAFLHRRIGYLDITRTIADTLSAHQVSAIDSLESILEADQWARRHSQTQIGSGL